MTVSDPGTGNRTRSVDVDLTGYPVTDPAAARSQTTSEPLGFWLDGNGKVTTDPGHAVAPSGRVREVTPATRPAGRTEPAGPGTADPVYVRTNTLAVLAFIFSLFGSAVLAVILGHIALKQISQTGERGHGLAMVGTIIGYTSTAVIAAVVIAGAVAAATT